MTLLLTNQNGLDLDGDAPFSSMLDIRRVLRIGGFVILAFVGIFALWGFIAPLSKAAIAPGMVQVEGHRRTVQHLEGGIVSQILVRENMHVKKGQPLVRLDSVQSGAAADAARSEYFSLLAEKERLEAELGGHAIKFSDELNKNGDRTREFLDNQRALLSARQASLSGQVDVLRATSSQASAEIGSLEAQIAAQRSQLTLLTGELGSVQQLVNEQLERKSRLLELQRNIAAVQGQIGSLTGQVLRARRSMAEASARIAALTSGRRDESQSRLRDVQMQLAEVQEKLKSASDVNSRRTIVAPSDGQVVQLRYTTVGGVVRPASRSWTSCRTSSSS